MSTVKTNNVQIGQSLTATNNFTWYQPSSPDGTVRLGNGNSGSVTDLVTLTSAGNLGIGTSSPSFRLDVANTARLSQGLLIQGSNLSAVASQVTIDQLSSTVSRLIAWGPNTTTPGILYLGNLSSNATAGSASNLVLDSSGNLGLGVTPSGWVDKAIQVTARAALSGNGNVMDLSNNAYKASGGWTYVASGVGSSLYEQYNGTHAWNTAPSGTAGNAISFTQAMTLDASGNLLVGTTSIISTERLNVTKAVNGGTGIAVFENTNNASGDQGIRVLLGTNASNTSSYLYVGRTGGVDKFYVYGNGNVVNANNSYGALSDQKIKENISDATPKLNDLLNVKVRSFNLKGAEAKQIGVVAQELEKIFPAMVEIDGMSGLKQVKYSVFVPMLIKAIQELSAELNELKGKIA